MINLLALQFFRPISLCAFDVKQSCINQRQQEGCLFLNHYHYQVEQQENQHYVKLTCGFFFPEISEIQSSIIIMNQQTCLNQELQRSHKQKGEQIESQCIQLNQQQIKQITIYKIFGRQTFSFQAAFAQSKLNWSAFYTQFSIEHSLRYLTKKWDDGAEFACLLKFKIKAKPNNIYKLIKVSHSLFGKPQISGEQKARAIKDHLTQTYNIKFKIVGNQKEQDNAKEVPLMKRLGQLGILLRCVDSQDQELIIAHELLNQNNFEYKGLAIFKRSSDGLLRTIAWKQYEEPQICEQQNQLNEVKTQIWHKIIGETQFQPYLILKRDKLLVEKICNKHDINQTILI